MTRDRPGVRPYAAKAACGPRTSRPGSAPVASPSRIGDLARHDGRVVAVRLLQQPLAAGRQVVGHIGPAEAEAVVVDDVEIGLLADARSRRGRAVRPRCAVSEVRRRISLRDGEPLALLAPIGQQPGRVAGVEDEADMRAAVAQPHDGVAVRQHRLGRGQVVVRVVGRAACR